MRRFWAVFLFFCCGCTSTYFYDRAQDFLDCWEFQFRVGRAEPNILVYPIGAPSPGTKPFPGFIPLYASVRCTKFFQVGSGAFSAKTYGMLGRARGVWEEKRGEWGISLLYYSRVQKKFISGNEALAKLLETPASKREAFGAAEKLADVDLLQPHDRSLLNIGFGVHIVTVGFDIGFNPLEFFDFLFGWIGVDFKKDDLATLREEEMRLQKEAEEEEELTAKK